MIVKRPKDGETGLKYLETVIVAEKIGCGNDTVLGKIVWGNEMHKEKIIELVSALPKTAF